MDEIRDHAPHEVISALGGDPPEAGGIHVDHTPFGVDTHGVGAVFQQPSEALFDRIER
jgi:hypothetical protein